MSGAREQILERARAALRAGELPDVPREYMQAGSFELNGAELLELFERRVTDYGARVRRAAPDGVAAAAAEALHAEGAARVSAPAALELELEGVELVLDDPPLPVEELERIDAALTGCGLAIAETGTIILDGLGRSGRRVISLIPDLHVCLVEPRQVVASVPDAIAALRQRGLHVGALTFISGPSATSDIGFERVEGVHGPRRLEVVLAGSAL
jgi:L-lactate dehydrogenase complex protein LldG